MNSYYLIKNVYVGPNQEANVDFDTVEIATQPARKNLSGEECHKGWCGTTNDVSVHALGRFDTIEAARENIKQIFGSVRITGVNGLRFESSNEHAVEVYKPGRFVPLNRAQSEEWVWSSMKKDVTASMKDADIFELMNSYESAANAEGFSLSGLNSLIFARRNELREDLED
jgi:hypothetical protein